VRGDGSLTIQSASRLTWFLAATDQNLSLDPSSTVFHYAFCLFEGMKAYRCEDGTVRLFRPDMNMKRMNRVSTARFLA
jgi:branched-chain amino acid aminotransferase